MVKKILLITTLLITIASFSQKRTLGNLKAIPNSFTTTTTISFESKKEQGVILIIKNVLGKTVFKKRYYTAPGKKSLLFEPNNLKAGMYIYAIQNNNEIISKRFVIK